MKLRVPAFYRDFACIAGACPDSCCQGWEVDADPASMAYYHTLPESEIRRRIFSVLDQDEYGNTIFRLSDQKCCPFLNSENLCDMHIAIGGEHTPFTCRTFPRFINDFGALREMGLSFSCPVAAEMMFDPKYDFSFTEEMNDLPPTLNDIDARLYFTLLSARKTAYALVQDSTKPLARCLAELLDFAEELQGQIGALPTVTEKMDFRSVFQNPELINPQWPEKVAAGDLTAPVGERIWDWRVMCSPLPKWRWWACWCPLILVQTAG